MVGREEKSRMADFTPQQFVDKWQRSHLKERASAQSHFDDVCRMLKHPTPAEQDPDGHEFTYEYGVQKLGGGQGFADVWYRGHFAIEYKGKDRYKTLKDAYQQLQKYRESLLNPPLLVVCDIEHWEIHTNFNNAPTITRVFTNEQIVEPEKLGWLRDMFEDPNRLHPKRTRDQITKEAAKSFQVIADELRGQVPTERAARFITRLVFCLFAEDVDLLPVGQGGHGLFTEIIEETRWHPERFQSYMTTLFEAMDDGGDVLLRKVRWFNGSLFKNSTVEALSVRALEALEKACQLDWRAVDPSIFGTLFERVIDPGKRAQLGLHYTSADDIRLIVEPVLMAPLRREWETTRETAAPIRAAYDAAEHERDRQTARGKLLAARDGMLQRLRTISVLDPACGSGNFLYVALQMLKNLEKEVITAPLWSTILPAEEPQVHPRQLYGIEINEIAHDLASIVVWIGHIQWKLDNGYFEFGTPILEALDNIQRKDAILAYGADGVPCEPDWPEADVIVGNPPFLGGQKLRGELGDPYVKALRGLYGDRLPGQSDLVCYWYERARALIEAGKAKRAGLLATNTIRQKINREVLNRIKDSGDIFMAWSDRDWVLEGAAVRISMVGFDNGLETDRTLDGQPASSITADLKAGLDVQGAQTLRENLGIAFMGDTKGGPFDVPNDLADQMLGSTNASGRSNRDVVRPWTRGNDITARQREAWIIDFGVDMPLEEAAKYELPFQHVKEHVFPMRQGNKRDAYRNRWWIHVEARPGMRRAVAPLQRFMVTPLVSKHRIFVWLEPCIPDARLIVLAREDDYSFGVLHSRIHEVWSLYKGAKHGGERPTYNVSTCFETFAFPWAPGQEPVGDALHTAISEAAKCLHEERTAWLNPVGMHGKALEKRTLTNLYNALAVFRGRDKGKVERAAGDFAPRLADLHDRLDRAVGAAYGWPESVLGDEDEMLRRLLELNLARG